jgi:hypothetical protein
MADFMTSPTNEDIVIDDNEEYFISHFIKQY